DAGVTEGSGEHPSSANWTAAVELIGRYAGRCLEAVTATKAVRAMSDATSAGLQFEGSTGSTIHEVPGWAVRGPTKVKPTVFPAATIALLTMSGAPRAQQPAEAPVTLLPTNHPRLPNDLSQLWLVPEPGRARTATQTAFATAVKLEVDGNFAKA